MFCICALYVENDIELSRLIGLVVVYDETKKDNNVTDCICVVYAEMKLNSQDLSDHVQSITKTK